MPHQLNLIPDEPTQDYRLIVVVAQRLPESVLQEDPGLLMYYDKP